MTLKIISQNRKWLYGFCRLTGRLSLISPIILVIEFYVIQLQTGEAGLHLDIDFKILISNRLSLKHIKFIHLLTHAIKTGD